jgi:hypothetical protein
MESFQLLAHPWWVNLLACVPFTIWWSWRRTGLHLPLSQLGWLTVWGTAFGFVEATVVVYLRAVIGLSQGYGATLADIARLSSHLAVQPSADLPVDLLALEGWREGATIVMLVGLALIVVRPWRERAACFLWAFATWDLAYYGGLWATIRWPSSLTTLDTLFLIPVPWTAQIWFPVLVSMMTIVAVMTLRQSRVATETTTGCRRESRRSPAQ